MVFGLGVVVAEVKRLVDEIGWWRDGHLIQVYFIVFSPPPLP